tara:strand:- start:1006 stop:2076 length:1071 start_codon:yes stop_codon:yes gene_type:complete
MKVISIVGARPQFIKLAEIESVSKSLFDHKILHTGQHYDKNMSDVFFKELEINEPDFNLAVGSGSHAYQTSKMIEGIDEIILKENPDYILVYGDTNSTLAGSIVCSKYSGIRIGHVEAGLRSFNRNMPEEINRLVADQLSHDLFCPTLTSIKNLRKEGMEQKAHLTGDVMCDSIQNKQIPLENQELLLKKYGIKENGYVLLTLHRPQNVDNTIKLVSFLEAFSKINYSILWPIHPRTRNKLIESGNENAIPENVITCDPLSYREIICLIKNSVKVLTDSGGLQKEAYILEKPCLTMRGETEWIETLENNWNILVNDNFELLIEKANQKIILGSHKSHYGDGFASNKIVQIIKEYGG